MYMYIKINDLANYKYQEYLKCILIIIPSLSWFNSLLILNIISGS